MLVHKCIAESLKKVNKKEGMKKTRVLCWSIFFLVYFGWQPTVQYMQDSLLFKKAKPFLIGNDSFWIHFLYNFSWFSLGTLSSSWHGSAAFCWCAAPRCSWRPRAWPSRRSGGRPCNNKINNNYPPWLYFHICMKFFLQVFIWKYILEA